MNELDTLILYTNDPTANITGLLAFGSDEDGLRATLMLDFAVSPERQESFRFALVGRNKMMFNAEMETKGQTGGLVSRSMKNAAPLQRTKDCRSGAVTTTDETLIVGGLGSAFLIGTDGVESVDPGTLFTILHFPLAHPSRDGTEYSIDLGSIGTPTEKDRVRMGPLEGVPEAKIECIDLGDGADVGTAGTLHATNTKWTVNIGGKDPQDKVLLADPVSEHPGSAVWTVTGMTRPRAVYIDAGLDRLHQTALFVGGLAAGIGTSYLVQGLTSVSTPRESRRQPS